MEMTASSERKTRSFVLFSGGIESTVLLYDLLKQQEVITPVFFDYGQKNFTQELLSIHNILLSSIPSFYRSKGLLDDLQIIRLNDLKNVVGDEHPLLSGSKKDFDFEAAKDVNNTTAIESQDLPLRNEIFLSFTINLALSKYDNNNGDVILIYLAEPHAQNTDCSKEFVKAYNNMLSVSLMKKYPLIKIIQPYADLTDKKQIVKKALELGVDLEKTWTCINPISLYQKCGKCNPCIKREKAISENVS